MSCNSTLGIDQRKKRKHKQKKPQLLKVQIYKHFDQEVVGSLVKSLQIEDSSCMVEDPEVREQSRRQILD